MKIGVQSGNWYNELKPSQSMKYIKECGFDSIDYNINNLFDETFKNDTLTSFFDKDIPELLKYFEGLKNASKESEIEISQMHGIFPICFEGENERNEYIISCTEKMMAVCRFLDCDYIVLHPWTGLDMPKAKEREINFSVFKRLIEPAKKYRVIICLENVFRHKNGKCVDAACSDCNEAIEYIDALNAEAGEEIFGFCLDTGHANLLGKNIYQYITALNHRLKALHIHDNNGLEDLHMIPFTQCGVSSKDCTLDWQGFISALKEIKYSGALSFETFRAIDCLPNELKTEGLKLIAKIGNYFADKIED